MALHASELEHFTALTWDEIAPRASVAIRGALENVLEQQDGACLCDEERSALANCDSADLLALLVAADTLRRDLVGNIVSYVVNRNINFTNICFVGCKFCAFSRGPREADSYFHSLEDMALKAKEAWELGATEVCIQGGLPHGLPPFYYRDILRAVKNAVPGMHIHAFSPMEIVYGVELTGMTLRDYLMMLRDNGLDTLPGTAAEILDDEVRHVLSRNKLSSAQWQEVIRTAHKCGIPSTSTLMYGHMETPDHWVRQLSLIAPDSVGDGRLHRIRAARFCPPEHTSVPAGTGALRADARRAPKDSCAGQDPARRVDSQHPGFVGEAEPQTFATVPARGRQRLWRNADGREYLA